MSVKYADKDLLVPEFQFKINTCLYPSKIEQILFREAKKWVEICLSNTEINANSQMALIYTLPLLEADPKNFYALYFNAITEPFCDDENWCDSWCKATYDYKNALTLAKEKLGLTDEYYTFCEDTSIHFGRRVGFRAGLRTASLFSASYEIDKFKKQLRNTSTSDPLYEEAKKALTDGERDFKKGCTEATAALEKVFNATFKVLYDLLDEQPIEKLSGKSFNAIEWINELKEVSNVLEAQVRFDFMSVNMQSKLQFDHLCDKKLIAIHEWRVSKYWEAHPDEKAELENSIIKMKNEISSLESENAITQQSISAEVDIKLNDIELLTKEFETKKGKILDEIQTLEEDKSKQGLFAFGAKKELKNKIADKQADIEKLEKQLSDQISEIREKICRINEKGDTASKEFSKKISDLKVQINSVTNILSNKEE